MSLKYLYTAHYRVSFYIESSEHSQTPACLGDDCTCSCCCCCVFLVPRSEERHDPPLHPPPHPLFLTFKIPSNSPPLVQEEGDVTPKVGCMVSNYSPRLSCSRREHWSGSITPPCPLLPPSYPPTNPPTAVSPSMQPYLVPTHPRLPHPPFSSSDPLCQPPTPYTISHHGLTSHWSPLLLLQPALPDCLAHAEASKLDKHTHAQG